MRHLEKVEDELIGRDPKSMSNDDLLALGHKPMSPIKALRLRCLDCCGFQQSEVRKCVAVTCPAWPFRMGKNPWRAKRRVTEAQRATLAIKHGPPHRKLRTVSAD